MPLTTEYERFTVPMHCPTCGEPSPQTIETRVTGAFERVHLDGDWQCPTCGQLAHATAWTTQPNAATKPKPSAAPVARMRWSVRLLVKVIFVLIVPVFVLLFLLLGLASFRRLGVTLERVGRQLQRSDV